VQGYIVFTFEGLENVNWIVKKHAQFNLFRWILL
jgi:hypothetical protein